MQLALLDKNIHEIIKQNEKYKNQHRRMFTEIDKLKLEKRTAIQHEKEKYSKVSKLLKEQQGKVVKPLILEV